MKPVNLKLKYDWIKIRAIRFIKWKRRLDLIKIAYKYDLTQLSPIWFF